MQIFDELYGAISGKMGYSKENWSHFKDALNSSLRRQFFELYEAGYSEKEIAHELFRADIAVAAHRNTKFEVKTALYNELLKFRPSNYQHSSIQQSYYKAYQQYTIFKTLRGFFMNSSVLDIGTNLLKRSMTYDFTDITVEVSRQLFLYHTEKNIDPEQIDKYVEIFKHYSEVQRQERDVEVLWAQFISLLEKSPQKNHAAIKIADQYFEDHPLPVTPLKSFSFYIRYYLLQLYCLELKNDLHSFEEKALEAFEHFCNLPYDYKTGKTAFIYQLIYVTFKLDKLQKSLEYIDTAKDLAKKGEANWFIYLELKIRTLLHLGSYTEAGATYASMIGHRNFDQQPEKNRNRWVLLGAYIQFLRVINIIPGEKPSTQFINKHLNYLDKRHNQLDEMKVPHIILNLLFDIYRLEYNSIEAKIYELKSYCNTYLKKSSPDYRSSCFIKMLLQIPQNNFNPKVLERRINPYLEKLKHEGARINPERMDEIIPYEAIWNMMMVHINAPKRKRQSQYQLSDWTLGKRDVL